MDSRDAENTLTDQEQQLVASIDRRLRAALAVEPSADFAARVRSGIAQSPRAARGWSGWWLPAAAAVAILLAAAVGLINRTEEPPIAAPAVAVAPAPSEPPTAAPPIERRVVSEKVAVQKPRLPRSSGSKTEAAEVQVAPGQEEALRRFLALVNQERIDPVSVSSIVDPSEVRVVPSIESTIVPVTIEPLFPVPAGEKADPTVKEE